MFTVNTGNSNGWNADICNDPLDIDPLDIDLADMDDDLDLDILHGAPDQQPRIFTNRLEENGGGALPRFWDQTSARLTQNASGAGNYEQELGDIDGDGDGDVDLYGLNWTGFTDIIAFNDGTGVFGPKISLPGSGADDNEGDFFDYDLDGDLDIFVANFSGADKLYRNDGSGNYTLTSGVLQGGGSASNGASLDADIADIADVDNDGDYDVFIAEDNNGANVYLENITNLNDTTAPSLFRLEQADDRLPSAEPTVVRVQVYDNAPYYITWYNSTTLEYSVDGSPFTAVPMMSSGGQIFRGEIPGNLTGTICYRAYSADQYGNTSSTTAELCFESGDAPTIYCTPKPSSSFCMNIISTSDLGNQPTSGASDYSVTASDVQGFKNGLLFAGISGPAALPFVGGTLCVNPPTKRGPLINSGGTAPDNCTGSFSQVVNDGAIIPFGLDAGPGNTGWFQFWYRDPLNGAGDLGTALSDAVELDFQ